MITTDESIKDVGTLSNQEICVLLAKLQGLTTYSENDMVRVSVTGGDDYDYNPIENGSQALELAEKFYVLRDFEAYDSLGCYWYVHEAQNEVRTLEYDSSRQEQEISASKAICLAIIEAYHGEIYRG